MISAGGGELMTEAASLGVAGLIGWLWLMERRGGQAREAQLTEAHGRIVEQRTELAALMALVRDTASALTTLGEVQRELLETLRERLPVEAGRPREEQTGSGRGAA